VIGSTNVDLVLDVPALPMPGETVLGTGMRREAGGKGANQACALVRLGGDVTFVSAVGADDDGRWSLDQLIAAGVSIDQVVSREGSSTGRAVVMVDPTGENAIVVVAGANELVAPPPTYDADVVLLSLEIPLEVVRACVHAAHAAGIPVVLNAAPAQPLPPDLLSRVEVLLVNESELAALGGDTQALLDIGAGAVVVTLGAKGCQLYEPAGTTSLPAADVAVVDTTGAGDCFAAALSYGVGAGWPLARAATLAIAAAALAVTRPGARGGQPTLSEARALLPTGER